MFDYILRLLILLPIVGGMAWGSLWLWKRVQMGVPLTGGQKQGRPIEMVGVLPLGPGSKLARSEEHTSELQSLMRISYAVFCLKKTTHTRTKYDNIYITRQNSTY